MQATKKGEQTREMILERAAQLFSLKGYFGSSMSDLAQETGLGKSGFYNHFQSKDDLALQAFDYAAAEMSKRFQQALEGKPNAIERLQALLEVFQGIADHPFLAGGCHLLNTAIESDDAHPALRERAIKSADKWQAMLQAIVRKGIERGEVRPEISAEDFATIPVMLNFNFTPHRHHPFGLSAGASIGYRYSAREKFKSSAHGKQKTYNDFDLYPWKISYIGELQLGWFNLYGSVASRSIFSRGLNQTPYSFGIRIGNW